MKVCLACMLLLLLSFVGCACPTAEPTPAPTPTPTPIPAPTPTPSPTPVPEPNLEYARQLAQLFCPIIHLNGEGSRKENFEPDPIQVMVDVAVMRDLENPTFLEKATISNLLNWSQSVYYIDVVDLNPKVDSPAEYKTVYDYVKTGYKPTVYARVKEADSTGHTVVQYWLFYYLNDWRNIHEGDWELVQLDFPGYTAEEIMAKGELPIFAAYSQHQAGQKMSWSAMNDNGLVEENHPVVYVAQGSHANYFTPGQFWSGLDFDDTGLSSWQTLQPGQLDIILLSESGEEGLEWLQFQGDWGEYIGTSISVLELRFWQRGPYGPPWSEGGKKSERWENPDVWATQLPEYPEPFWKSFLKLPGDWSKLAIFSVFSPADLHVYDSLGRHVGIDDEGNLESQIPGAIYITPESTDYKTVLIPDAVATDEYVVVAKGTGSGTMDIKAQVPDPVSKLRRFLEYIGIPVLATTTARASIEPPRPEVVRAPSWAETLSGTTRDMVTTLEVDSDGDGTFEIESTPGDFETQKEIRPVLDAAVDIKPDMLYLGSTDVEEPITAYIELPADLSPKDIDISTVLLFGSIPALKERFAIIDHDQNGIYELAVNFDWQSIVNHLISTKQVEGEFAFTVAGSVHGQLFAGADIVPVTISAPN